MKLEVNITKARAFAIVGAILIFAGIFGVIAFNTNMGASVMGHSVGEIDWNGILPKLTVSGETLLKPANVVTGPAAVCIDNNPGLIYELDGSIAKVYISGTNPSGTWGYGCGGMPGLGNENQGKVLFAEWSWTEVTGTQSVTVSVYENTWPADGGLALVSRTFTSPTMSPTLPAFQSLAGDSYYTAAGAQNPSLKLSLVWDNGAKYAPSPLSFVK